MTIDVVLNPAEIAILTERDLSATTCVVFDVLRATSTMITALAHGATEIYPVCTIDEALSLKAQWPHALLGGERQGEAIAGFDLGNSPLEYRDNVRGRTIITTTTNGTVALRACDRAQRVLIGALLNLDALAAELCRGQTSNVLLVCAGTFDSFALEDALGAGALVREMSDRGSVTALTDSAQAALAIAAADENALLRMAKNARALLGKGRAEEVEWCSCRSRYRVVGFMQTAVIRPLHR
jgi:2-phosphosulfolactate phosphatase